MTALADLNRGWRAAWPEIALRSAAMPTLSLLEQVALLPRVAREALLANLTPAEYRSLAASWEFSARPKQLEPDALFRWWFLCGGRGTGKSSAGANWIRHRVERCGAMAVGLVGPKMADVVGEMLNDPDAGLFSVFPAEHRPEWVSKKDGVFSFYTGAMGYCYSAEDPELRGPNLDTVWLNEPVKWYQRDAMILLDNIERALRKTTSTGARSCGIVTSTPAQMTIIKTFIADPGCITVTGSTDENVMGLDPAYLARLDQRLVSATTAARERRGEMVEDEGGALWTSDDIEATRVQRAPALTRVLVSIDPSASTKTTSDDTGIVVVGLGEDGEVYVLADETGRHRPEVWGARAVALYRRFGADGVLVEDNRIGDSAAATVRAAMREKRGSLAAEALPIIEIHALRGKGARAEPVATLWKRGLVHIVGELPELEVEMTSWDPLRQLMSPNRIDAMVHGVVELAGLDDAPAKDGRAGFVGIERASHDLRASTRESRTVHAIAGLSGALPRGGWGSTI